jgi:CHAT domain-containing protein/cytochrome c-type biogenesis protein CcmH/NrfG
MPMRLQHHGLIHQHYSQVSDQSATHKFIANLLKVSLMAALAIGVNVPYSVAKTEKGTLLPTATESDAIQDKTDQIRRAAAYKTANRYLSAGLKADRLDNQADAINQWQLALKSYRELNDLEGTIIALIALDGLNLSGGDYGKQLQSALKQQPNTQLPIPNPQSPNRPTHQQRLYESVGLALVHRKLAQGTQALVNPYADLADAIALDQQRRQIEILTTLAQQHVQLGDANRAAQLYEQALRLNPQLLLGEQRMMIQKGLLNSYFSMSENARAIEFHQRQIASQLGQRIDSAEKALPFSSLARSYATIGAYSESLNAYQNPYQQILVSCAKVQDASGKAHCSDAGARVFWQNQAYVEATVGNYRTALSHLDQVKAIKRRMDNRVALGVFLDVLSFTSYLVDNSKQNQYSQSSSNYTPPPKSYFIGWESNIRLSPTVLLEIFSRNLTIARSSQYVSGQPTVLIGLGRIHASLGEHAQALERYREGLILSRKLNSPQQEWAALAGMSRAYEALGDLAKAQETYQQSLTLAKQVRQLTPQHADLKLQSAYDAVGEYGKAVDFYQQSLDLANSLGDESGIIQALLGLGDSYQAMEQPDQARNYYQKANQIATKPETQLLAKLSLSKNEYERGQYELAKTVALEAQRLGEMTQNQPAERSAWILLGKVAFLQGAHQQSAQNYETALALSRSLRQGDRKNDKENIRSEFLDLVNLGKAYLQLGNISQSLNYYKSALDLANQLDAASQIVAHQNLGELYMSQGDYTTALKGYETALRLTYNPQDLKSESIILTKIGTLRYYLGDWQEAEKKLYDALKIQEVLQNQANDNQKVAVFETQQTAYEILQQVLVAQNKFETALEVAERGRARAFAGQLIKRIASRNLSAPNNSESKPFQPLPLAAMQDLAAQDNRTFVVYSIVKEFPAKNKQQSLTSASSASLYIWVLRPNRQINFRRVDAQTIQAKWSQLQTSQPQTCTAVDSVFDNLVGCWVEQMQMQMGVKSRDPQPAKPIGSTVKGQNSSTNLEMLNQLHRLLIQPIAEFLPIDPSAHVTIVPQGKLFLVPFQALKDDTGRYIVESHTLSVANSLSSLNLSTELAQMNAASNSSPPQKSSDTNLIVGNPTMPTIVNSGLTYPLSPLPGSEKEAQAIAKLLNTQALIGPNATKSDVLSKLSTARRIHFATHGFFDEVRGIGSALALAPDTANLTELSRETKAPEAQLFSSVTRETQPRNLFNQEINGFLTAQEISSQSLRADLVVLSACNTGQGRITGDGVLGLSRSFLTAGAASIVVSLWAVPDSPTATLMERFYLNQQSTTNKSQALRQAMLDTMKTNPNPRDWGAFLLIGEPQRF